MEKIEFFLKGSNLSFFFLLFLNLLFLYFRLIYCNENVTYDQSQIDIIDPHLIKFAVRPNDSCPDNEKILFAYIFTKAANFDKRIAIRKTWGNNKIFKNLKLGFILGLNKDPEINSLIEHEGRIFNDILQGTFIVKNFYLFF